jgi:hypothetical protein
MVGWVIRGNGGRFLITSYTSATRVDIQVVEASENLPDPTADVAASELFKRGWRVSEFRAEIDGLDHLEGREVSILADGSVQPRQIVSGGKIVLAAPASQVFAGLPYRCIGKTLSLTDRSEVIDGMRKRYAGVAVRLTESRGMKFGTSLAALYAMKESPVLWGEPIPLSKGVHYVSVSSGAVRDDGLYFVQDDPLPAALLGLVIDAEASNG